MWTSVRFCITCKPLNSLALPVLCLMGSFIYFNLIMRRRPRYIHGGLKYEVDERALFTEDSRTMRTFTNSSVDDPLQLTPLTMSSYSKQSSSSVLEQSRGSEFYNHLQLQSLADAAASKQQQKQNLDQNYYFLGRDLKCQTPSNAGSRGGEEEEEEEKKDIHHHFLKEWAPKGRDSSWLNTQLSISIPDSSHDFPIFNSRTHNGTHFRSLPHWCKLFSLSMFIFCKVIIILISFVIRYDTHSQAYPFLWFYFELQMGSVFSSGFSESKAKSVLTWWGGCPRVRSEGSVYSFGMSSEDCTSSSSSF